MGLRDNPHAQVDASTLAKALGVKLGFGVHENGLAQVHRKAPGYDMRRCQALSLTPCIPVPRGLPSGLMCLAQLRDLQPTDLGKWGGHVSAIPLGSVAGHLLLSRGEHFEVSLPQLPVDAQPPA